MSEPPETGEQATQQNQSPSPTGLSTGHPKNKIDRAIKDLHEAENDLVKELELIAEAHKGDHEIFHVVRDLRRWSTDHLVKLAETGTRYGLELDPESEGRSAVASALRGNRPTLRPGEPAPLALLRHLRELYGSASRVQLDWEVLAQAAQAARDTDLVELAEACRPETQRQVKWAESKLKESAAQALVTP